MNLKTDAKGAAVLRNGKPVYLGPNGSETAFDYAENDKKYRQLITERDGLKEILFGDLFGRSKFVAEKLAIPADLARARFTDAFALEGGKIVGKTAVGNNIYSTTRPGELADFDEALAVIVTEYPHRDAILKKPAPTDAGGLSSKPESNRNAITRTAFDALPSEQKRTAAREMTIID